MWLGCNNALWNLIKDHLGWCKLAVYLKSDFIFAAWHIRHLASHFK
jgi:hypothetical protein